MKRLVIYVFLIAAGFVCYFVGFGEGVVPLIALYLVLEFFLMSRLGAAFGRWRQRD